MNKWIATALLCCALPAHAFEAGSAAIDARTMARAFAPGGPKGADASDREVLRAREAAAKMLGEYTRDLVFVPITPCTVWDSRFAPSAPQAGAIANATTRRFYAYLEGGGSDFTGYGGNPACPQANLNFIGFYPFAALMTVYVNDAAGNGWLTFYRDGDPDPSQATISVYYSPGPTRTQTVISKSGRGYAATDYDIAVTGRFSTAHASASVVGYFLLPTSINLPTSTPTSGNILKNGARFIHNYGGVFLGENAGNFTIQGGQNTGIGSYALHSIEFGGGNTAVGSAAMSSATQSQANTALGAGAMYENTTGLSNTALGAYSLIYNTTGSNNIAIGNEAGTAITTGDWNLDIGHPGFAGDANTIRIGQPGHLRTFLAGIRGVTTGAANAVPVLIDTNGQLGTINSSRRVKDDIEDMSEASSGLMKLRPVTFHYRGRADPQPLEYGLIAEEVAEVYPGLVARKGDGETETVMYQYLPTMLLNEVQKQERRIAELEKALADLSEVVKRKKD